MSIVPSIRPCLWFDNEAEPAATFYTGIFPNSRIVNVVRYPEAGQETHHRPPGSVMVVEFDLDGQRFTGLNGGPIFKFTEAVSFGVHCDSQKEVDHYWEKLGEGGDPRAQQCGWLKDKFGLSWQIIPAEWTELMRNPNAEGAKRAFTAMLTMKKLDMAELRRAYEGA